MKLADDDIVRYYTFTDEQVCGPYSVEALESLAYLQKIAPDTPVCREGLEEFTPLRDSELGPILFPHMLLPKQPDEWAPPGQENNPAYFNRKRHRFTEAKFEKINAEPGELPEIDVFKMLNENREKEIEAGHDFVRPSRFKISRRTVDFWVALLVGNGLFLGVAFWMQNTWSFVFGIAGSGLFTFALIWSTFGLMDDY